jgi:hypothetical protein
MCSSLTHDYDKTLTLQGEEVLINCFGSEIINRIRKIATLSKIIKLFFIFTLITWISHSTLVMADSAHKSTAKKSGASHVAHKKKPVAHAKKSVKKDKSKSTPKKVAHKTASHNTTHKTSHHKQTSHKKNHHAAKKHKRIMKPHIVKKSDVVSNSLIEKNLQGALTVTNAARPETTVEQPKEHRVVKRTITPPSFHHLLTQPMSSPEPKAMEETEEIAQTSLSIPKPGFAASIEQRLVNFVHKSVNTLRYSAYKLGGTRIDTSQGIYIVDCSGYVDYTLRAVYPNAYFHLVGSSGVDKPNTSHYYDFFTSLSDDPDRYWSKIEDIEHLRPGDILVFRYKNTHGRSTGGHVMVVMNKPERDGDAYVLSVADSAASGHSEDTRQNHVSGVGIGTILLKINPKTKQPSAYAWTVNSRWKDNVNFAMARPLETCGAKKDYS